jgi:PAT family beta-lactamase induction signal transducer AmpG
MTRAGSPPSPPQPADSARSGSIPAAWVPTLYFSQGIPYVVVMTLSVVMYKRLGVSNTDIALYTSWLYLPWVIKPLWSPLVDMTRTKRFWIVAMQFLVSLALASAAFAIRRSAFFRWSLFLFWIMAFASATHDIAADGFYMLSLSPHQQAWWVGLRSTFYRTAMVVGSGLLVVLAGVLESRNGLPPLEVPVCAGSSAGARSLPDRPAPGLEPGSPLRLVADPASLVIPPAQLSADEAGRLIARARQSNADHGFLQQSVPGQPSSPSPLAGAWAATVSDPLKSFLTAHFPKNIRSRASAAGSLGRLSLALSSAPPPGQNLVVTLERKKGALELIGLAKGDDDFQVVEGDRLVFNSRNWNQPAQVLVQRGSKQQSGDAIVLLASSGSLPLAWSITLFVVAALFLAFSCWHAFILPRPAADGPVFANEGFVREFLATFSSFFRKPGVVLALAFILFYRFDEAQLVKVISPFLLDTREAGGLGLTTSQVGLAYGTCGVMALTCGGLLGGFWAARRGLKFVLPFMAFSMYLPKLAFLFLAFVQPGNFLIASAAVALEQFGYGFGFTAFMLYLLYFSDGPHRTAHYAICTGFMALGMMLPGLWSGWLADVLGYRHFFAWVICSALPGLGLALLLKVDPRYGKKAQSQPELKG